MDRITPAARSRNMSLIKSKNTKPEIILRKALFKEGLRFRIHYNLPGKPDIVFPRQKIAIFVHGCFWHGHGCKFDHIPKSNSEFWKNKIAKNKARDLKTDQELRGEGWRLLVVWECEIWTNLQVVVKELINFNFGQYLLNN